MLKLKSIALPLFAVVIWSVSSASLRDPNNPPTGQTGAPGETTCQRSGCHNGGSFTGTVTITGVPDTVVPNQTYTLTVTNASNCTRAGFEITSLDANNKQSGVFSSASGVSVATANNTGRQYARQAQPKTMSGGKASWSFPWKAPASATGNAITFYFVSLAANGNGKESSDNALKGNHSVTLKTVSAAQELQSAAERVALYPSLALDVLHLDLKQSDNADLAIYDMQGNAVMQQRIGKSNTLTISQLPAGNYLAKVTEDGKACVVRFVKQ